MSGGLVLMARRSAPGRAASGDRQAAGAPSAPISLQAGISIPSLVLLTLGKSSATVWKVGEGINGGCVSAG